MKKTIPAVCAFAAVLMLSPFHSRDAAKLIPVQTLSVRMDGDLCLVESDSGQHGRGIDPRNALSDLERTAPGILILSTARQIVVDESAMAALEELIFLDDLHPGTEVYDSAAPINAVDATPFLNRHASGVSISRLRSAYLTGEAIRLPCLTGGEGRYRIDETP